MSTDPHTDRDQNPFAAPRETDAAEALLEPTDGIQVYGEFLIVGKAPILPDRCVVTNQPTTADDRRLYELSWAPSFRLVLDKSVCRPSYSLCREHQRRLVRRKILVACGFSVVFVLIFGSIFGALGGLMAGLFFGLVGLADAFKPMGPLTINRTKDGRFWLRGCGIEFLHSCQAEFGTYDGQVGKYD